MKFITITSAGLAELLASDHPVDMLNKLHAEQQVDKDIAQSQGFDGPLPPADGEHAPTEGTTVPARCGCRECELERANEELRAALATSTDLMNKAADRIEQLEARHASMMNRQHSYINQLKQRTTERDDARGDANEAASALSSEQFKNASLTTRTNNQRESIVSYQAELGELGAKVAKEVDANMQLRGLLITAESKLVEVIKLRNLLADIHGMTGLRESAKQAA